MMIIRTTIQLPDTNEPPLVERMPADYFSRTAPRLWMFLADEGLQSLVFTYDTKIIAYTKDEGN